MSYADQVRSFMKVWRMSNLDSLRKGAFLENAPSEATLRQTMRRLRRAKALFTSRLGTDFLHFDPSLKNRWAYIEKLPVEERQIFKSRSGIEHHLKLQELALNILGIDRELQILPNTLSETAHSTFSGRHKHLPDLSIVKSLRNSKTILYVELERSLKAKSRYLEKWRAYESDEQIAAVLYCTTRPETDARLEEAMKQFFDRSNGFDGFQMALVKEEDVNSLKGRAPLRIFELRKAGAIGFEEFLENLCGREERISQRSSLVAPRFMDSPQSLNF